MEAVTIPRSFEDTTPAQMLRDFTRRRTSSPHPPLKKDQQAPPESYGSVPSASTSQRTPGGHAEHGGDEHVPSEDDREDSPEPQPPKKWRVRRIWDAVKTWERDNVELVLENKQSVARDHLGISLSSLIDRS
jgi:hypothetical protein